VTAGFVLVCDGVQQDPPYPSSYDATMAVGVGTAHAHPCKEHQVLTRIGLGDVVRLRGGTPRIAVAEVDGDRLIDSLGLYGLEAARAVRTPANALEVVTGPDADTAVSRWATISSWPARASRRLDPAWVDAANRAGCSLAFVAQPWDDQELWLITPNGGHEVPGYAADNPTVFAEWVAEAVARPPTPAPPTVFPTGELT